VKERLRVDNGGVARGDAPVRFIGFRGGLAVKFFTDQRGSFASELSFGATVVAILVVGGLFAVAQIEGVSFAVLLHQLRSSR
jgi:hypothetical protein